MTVNLMREDPAILYGAPLLGSRCQAGQLRDPLERSTKGVVFSGLLLTALQPTFVSSYDERTQMIGAIKTLDLESAGSKCFPNSTPECGALAQLADLSWQCFLDTNGSHLKRRNPRIVMKDVYSSRSICFVEHILNAGDVSLVLINNPSDTVLEDHDQTWCYAMKSDTFRDEYITIIMSELLCRLEYLHSERKFHREA
ncbi:hypothetical protein ARMSODRAFT_1020935 [Armillaria solidipes]|uniref:Protein kinase domain-containing protein n=1 Tax=Armillaria solidipes TaxID=1076256 RepID=A0A2H3BV87_9AGAR|nr:hypothetical protein ARMSODRAFT_1020935 [Armillaria solidipes]